MTAIINFPEECYDPAILKRVLFENFKLANDAQIVVAYSGGCDSQVLLNSLANIRESSKISVSAAHFDHGLQVSSSRWANQCRRWSKDLGIKFRSVRREVVSHSGHSLEALAREARYRWLDEILEPGEILLTAHHADDQAETFLLHLFQGKSIEQLAGIAQSRDLLWGSSNRLIRPMLGFTRNQILKYANDHALKWVEDPSNNSTAFYRNFIRKELAPILYSRNPDLRNGLVKAANSCAEVSSSYRLELDRLLSSQTRPDKRSVFCLADPFAVSGKISASVSEFADLVRHWIHKSGCSSPTNGQLDSLRKQIVGVGVGSCDLRGSEASVRFYGGHLYLIRQLLTRCFRPIDWDFSETLVPEVGLKIVPGNCWSSEEDRNGSDDFSLNWRQGGETFRLPGRKHKTSLKKLFQARRIPPWERDYLPYLVCQDKIIWVYGIGESEDYRQMFKNNRISPIFSLLRD